MGSDRNLPCPCGSGKKYKKCCLNGYSISTNVVSDNLKEKLGIPCWFHGTDQTFHSWTFPPPKKPGENLLVPHTALFFTTNFEFAKEAGRNVARVALSSDCRVLDATENYSASERLRAEVKKNEIAARTLNVDHDYWHHGWKTGDVLRMAYNDPVLSNHLNKIIADHSTKFGLPIEAASTIVQHNSARGLIELICVSAKKLGFDALFGHEVDRHSIQGEVIAQPWLAVLEKGVVTDPVWC